MRVATSNFNVVANCTVTADMRKLELGGSGPYPRAEVGIKGHVTRMEVLVILCAVTPVGGSANFMIYPHGLKVPDCEQGLFASVGNGLPHKL